MIKFRKIVLPIALVSAMFALAKAQEPEKVSESADEFAAQVKRFTRQKVGEQKYILKYKFKKGDVIRWSHDHQTAVETRFGTASDKTSTRARPNFKWTVQNIDSRGSIRFDIEMESIKVLEQMGEAEPVYYDSDKHKEAPDSCVAYQERLGRVCSTYSISPNGQVVDKKSNYSQIKLGGVGDNPVIAFPSEPVAIGHQWGVTDIVKPKDEFGSPQQVKLRVKYTLEKVVDGKAHITFSTDVLTPQIDETMRSQIAWHMARGFVVFDIAKGAISHRESRWDERVIGYQGPESYMHYSAFRKETLVVEEPVAVASKIPAVKTESEKGLQRATLLQPMNKK